MKTTILKIKPMKQTKSGFCGPVALKMVLDFYGIDKSEAEVAILSNKDDDLGIGDEDIKRTLEGEGLKVEIKKRI